MKRTTATLILALALAMPLYAAGSHHPGSIYASLGQTLTGEGLRAAQELPGDGYRLSVAGGRACRGTWCARGIDGLGFRATALAGYADQPTMAEITYFDNDNGSFALQYSASDAAGRNGIMCTRKIVRHDTRTWRTAEVSLPDAYADPEDGLYVRVTALDGQDVFVRQVALKLQGIAVRVAQPMIGADGQSRLPLRVSVRLSDGLLPQDGTEVKLVASAGDVDGSLQLKGGEAQGTYTAGSRQGNVVITALCAGIKGYANILLWPGNGAPSDEATLVDDFQSVNDWVEWGPGTQWTWTSVARKPEPGTWAGKLSYTFPDPTRAETILLTKRLYVRGLPWGLRISVKGDGSDNALEAIFEDATGQQFAVALCTLQDQAWRELEAPIWQQSLYWDGANDGRFHFPLYFKSLRLRHALQGKNPAASGVVLISGLIVSTLAPGE